MKKLQGIGILPFLLPLFFHYSLCTIRMDEFMVKLSGTDQGKLEMIKQAAEEYNAGYTEATKTAEGSPNKEEAIKKLKNLNKHFFMGLNEMINGARMKSPRKFLIGSLKVASTITASFGLYGMIASKMMLLMSKGLEIYGDVTSTSFNPTKVALENFQIANLELDIAGAKEYFDNFVNPIVVTGFENKDDKNTDITYEETKKDEKLKYTKSEAKQVIKNAQKRLELYGKLQFLIDKYCKNGDGENLQNDKTRLEQCMKTITLYVKLSQIHIAFLEASVKRIQNSDAMDPQTKKQFSFSVIGLLALGQKRDNETLHFLTDPMQYADKTDVIFELYSKQDEYDDIIDHLVALKPNRKSMFKEDRVVICREIMLKGLCREELLQEVKSKELSAFNERQAFEVKDENKKLKFLFRADNVLEKWHDTKSIFIPPHIRAYFGRRPIGGVLVGPLTGLAVYSSETKFNYKPLMLSTNDRKERSELLQICTKKKGSEARWCDAVGDVETAEYSFQDFKGVDLRNNVLDSIKVPEDYDVVMTSGGTTFTIIGPFTAKELDTCETHWETIKITKMGLVIEESAYEKLAKQVDQQAKEDAKNKGNKNGKDASLPSKTTDEQAKEDKDASLPSKTETATNPAKAKKEEKKQEKKLAKDANKKDTRVNAQRIKLTQSELKEIPRGDTFVTVCSEKKLKGFCKQILTSEFKKSRTRFPKLKDFFQPMRKGCNVKIKSIKIPAGKKVTLEEKFADEGEKLYAFGPYYGPVTLNNLHSSSTYKYVIKDVKDKDVKDDVDTGTIAETGDLVDEENVAAGNSASTTAATKDDNVYSNI